MNGGESALSVPPNPWPLLPDVDEREHALAAGWCGAYCTAHGRTCRAEVTVDARHVHACLVDITSTPAVADDA